MKIVVFTDIHGRITSAALPAKTLKQADLTILSGDITHFGGYEETRRVLDQIHPYCLSIFAVPGNCDQSGVGQFLLDHGNHLHHRVIDLNGIQIMGIGGSLPCPGNTPYEISENEYQEILKSLAEQIRSGYPLILVSHQPPFNTKNDLISNNRHVGSLQIRSFIEQVQPLVCFTGHIHEGVGIDQIGNTKIVNPGPFFAGMYTYAEISRQIDLLEIRKIDEN